MELSCDSVSLYVEAAGRKALRAEVRFDVGPGQGARPTHAIVCTSGIRIHVDVFVWNRHGMALSFVIRGLSGIVPMRNPCTG